MRVVRIGEFRVPWIVGSCKETWLTWIEVLDLNERESSFKEGGELLIGLGLGEAEREWRSWKREEGEEHR